MCSPSRAELVRLDASTGRGCGLATHSGMAMVQSRLPLLEKAGGHDPGEPRRQLCSGGGQSGNRWPSQRVPILLPSPLPSHRQPRIPSPENSVRNGADPVLPIPNLKGGKTTTRRLGNYIETPNIQYGNS